MTDTFIANGKELHADMKPMLEARKAAGPAGTIAEQRIVWEKYSDAFSKPYSADITTSRQPAHMAA